jgi:nucleoside-diphosphate-sugar epimerase
MSTVCIPGGAGYVGAVLVPKLLARGHHVRVLDTFAYGHEALAPFDGAAGLTLFAGDMRDLDVVKRSLDGSDAVIHLACISNDPSFELDPALGKSVNFDCFEPMVRAAKAAGVRRFIYASSSSVYGLSDAPDVREDHVLNPLTDYSKFKALCEPIVLGAHGAGFVPVVIRPATVCGASPRMRFDLSVNILTNHAVSRRSILVFGGVQTRPNIHIEDITDLYADLLDEREALIAGETFNAGFQNRSIADLAEIVRSVVSREFPDGAPIVIETQPTDDLRSYHVNSEKIERVLGFRPRHTIEDAVRDLCRSFRAGRFPDSLSDRRYFNVKLMKETALA